MPSKAASQQATRIPLELVECAFTGPRRDVNTVVTHWFRTGLFVVYTGGECGDRNDRRNLIAFTTDHATAMGASRPNAGEPPNIDHTVIRKTAR